MRAKNERSTFIRSLLYFGVALLSIQHSLALSQFSSPASFVIGQPDFTTNQNARTGLWTPTNVYVHNSKIYLADANDARILVYNTVPTENHATPDFAIGQPDLDNVSATVSASRTGVTQGIFILGTKLFITDFGNNRVLIFNNIPTASGAEADVVLGQPDFTSGTANNGGISAHSLSGPRSVWSDGTRLYITDSGNNRALIWNTIPTTNNQDADIVLGQATFTTGGANAGGRSAHSLSSPGHVFVHNNKLYLADTSNNRVLIWNTLPTSNNQDANIVLGQPDFTSGTANNGGVSAHSFSGARHLSISSTKLFVSDLANNRVLIWNTLPTSNNQDADLVLGQPDFTSNTANNGGISGARFNVPYSTVSDGTKLYVLDGNNNRLLIFNTVPTSSGAAADVVVGQQNMSANLRWNTVPSASTLHTPTSVTVQDGKMFVGNIHTNRVLIYNSIPTSNGLAADLVLGQPDFTSNTANNGGVSANSLSIPYTSLKIGSKFVVSDGSNHRVLVFNTFPTSNNASADVVIGQANFTTNTANTGSRSASTLSSPQGLATDGTKLFVADSANHRILIFNSLPTSHNASADVVLGQPDFTSGTANNGGISARSLNTPRRVYTDGTRLFVADYFNHRVLIWNTIPTTNYKTADVVLGQPGFTTATVNNGGLSAHSLQYPAGVYSDGTRLFVTDSYNQRVLIWNTIPTSNNVDADVILGQANFTSNGLNGAATIMDGRTFSYPEDVTMYQDKIYISDSRNNRILVFEAAPLNISASMPQFTQTTDITLTLGSTDAKEMMISEDANFTGASWEAFATTKQFVLSSAEGVKNVYVKFRDYANFVSDVITAFEGGITKDSVHPKNFEIGLSKKTRKKAGETTLVVNERKVKYYFDMEEETSEPKYIKICEHKDFRGCEWKDYDDDMNFKLSEGDETKYIYIKVRDDAGNESDTFKQKVELKTLPALQVKSVGTIELDFSKNKNYIYTDPSPVIAGTINTKSTVTMFVDGLEVAHTDESDENMIWKIAGYTFTEGKHTVKVVAGDSAVEFGLDINPNYGQEDTVEQSNQQVQGAAITNETAPNLSVIPVEEVTSPAGAPKLSFWQKIWSWLSSLFKRS